MKPKQASEALQESSLMQEVDREKQESRDADARALASGRKSGQELNRNNGIFRGFRFRVDLKSAKRLW
jgi:hypothetical protein